MYKKLMIIVICAIVLSVSVVLGTFAASTIKIFINDKEITTDVQPQIIQGRVMVPLKWVVQALGANVKWDNETRTVIIQMADQGSILLSESDSGKKISLAKGQVLHLSLPGNPSTGYSWSYVKEPDQLVLKEINHEYFSDSTLVGAGGTDNWEFKAMDSGSTTLSLIYSRPWESVQPEKTFQIEVTVQ
ncbi:MAG TPA: hypothetical protein DCK76_03100 [Desulfotomaculum sp.]|nr:MAG: Putative secreted protein [Desulfotomaculum sp. 46_80]HAG10377.1 hypothetical protein [Desulfotomaculum sp.]HBY04166.1 hypothetical protein [Desulfotomaculum sp.]